ncbi:hypothetical protein H6F88_32160 [Oculatella sp. FACHB-28]|uniref:hypothetical protein n=1 Tax=Oculatella sp. FACHB-28 TaxID=2692845 RepID=UPI001687AD91|nr:hypothetical protein [Oculatella sp. FACHB-28]MBD2060600.1 hypothetical protein [Oculatella sp. FACHB-28]
MNTSTKLIINTANKQHKSIQELTNALERVIQELAIASPQTISLFFDGTEVYRHQTQDDNVFWWGTNSHTTPSGLNSSNSLLPSHQYQEV